MIDAHRIGAQIAAARRLRKISQGQLARTLGVHETTIQRLETGHGLGALRRLERVCLVLGLTLADVVVEP